MPGVVIGAKGITYRLKKVQFLTQSLVYRGGWMTGRYKKMKGSYK